MRVGLAGFGTAGQEVARRLVAGAVPGLRLTAVTARDLEKARANAAKLEPAPAVVPLEELPERRMRHRRGAARHPARLPGCRPQPAGGWREVEGRQDHVEEPIRDLPVA